MAINISKIKKYGKKHGTENFSPKLNKIIEENKVRVDNKIELDKQKEKLDDIKLNLERRGFDTTIFKDDDIVFLDTFSHQTRLGFETMEMHEQIGTTLYFSILNITNSNKQFNSLLELLNNYKGVEVKKELLEGDSIYITIKFIEPLDFNKLNETELEKIVEIKKKNHNYPKITENETNKVELIGNTYQLEDLTDENIDFLYKLNDFFKNDFYCLEMHHQMGKTIDYSIHFGNDFTVKYMALKEFLENYNGVEIEKFEAKDESIYLTISFIEEDSYKYSPEKIAIHESDKTVELHQYVVDHYMPNSSKYIQNDEEKMIATE